MARSVVVTLSANVGNLIAGMNAAARATEQAAGRMMQSAGRNSAEWNTVGSTLTRVGAVAAAGLGLSAKAAMDWESAWAGVKKTVDQTSPAFATLEGDLRSMAREMATSHTEIAAVAESAGALGVATEDVAGFTRTMIMLGETTNLSAGDAADSLAQFMNVMGTAPDMVDNLGSALVALGNDGASTERQIVEMGQRIAAAGRQIGMNEAEVMGFASALASVGIEAEAGGTAISTSFLKMEQAVRNGGTQLETFAEVAGMSVDEFSQAFERDAAGAVTAFVEGLGRVQEAGGDVTGILTDLGITGIREADTLRRLASSGDLLADSLATAADSMASGTALMDEYAERANTTEARVAVAWNNIKDAAISAGQALLPVIASAAQGIAELAQWFGSLDPAVLAAGAAIAAAVAAIGLIGGGVIKAVVALAELRAALTALGVTSALTGRMTALAGAVQGFATKAVIAAAAAYALGRAIDAISGQSRSMDDAALALDKLGTNAEQAGRDLNGFFSVTGTTGDLTLISDDILSVSDALTRLNNKSRWQEINDGYTQFKEGLGLSAGAATILEDRFATMDARLSQMVGSGNLTGAQEAFKLMATEAVAGGHSVESLAARFPGLKSALEQTAASMGVHNLTAAEYARWMGGEVPAAVQEAAAGMSRAAGPAGDLARQMDSAGSAAREMAAGMLASANAMLQLSGAQSGVEAAVDAVTESIDKNGKSLDRGTAAGRENWAALDGIAGAALRVATSQAEANESAETIHGSMQRNRDEFIRAAEALDMNADQARRLADDYGLIPDKAAGLVGGLREAEMALTDTASRADQMAGALAGIPDDKTITVDVPGVGQKQVAVDDLAAAIEGVPDDKRIIITLPNGQALTATAGEIRAGIESIPGYREAVLAVNAAAGKEEIVTFQTMVDSTTGKTVVVGTISDPSGQRQTQIAVDSTTGKTVWVRTIGDTSGAAAAEAAVARVHNRTVYITTVHRTIGVTSSDRFGGPTRADGGLIPAYAGPTPKEWVGAQRLSVGGVVGGWSPHPRADNIPILGTAGEVMMSNWAGDRYGRDRLLAINSGRIDPRAFSAFMSAQGFADGGLLRPQRPATHAYAAAPAGSMGGVVHNTSITVNNPVARSWAESVRQESALAAVGR